jgi:hypothetical protein
MMPGRLLAYKRNVGIVINQQKNGKEEYTIVRNAMKK